MIQFNSFKYILIAIILVNYYSLIVSSSDEKLEVVKESELKQLFKEEKYVIILLSNEEKCEGKCEVFEDTLLSVREDLVETTGGWVIRSHAPGLSKLYGLKESTILFMREGKPLLYTGSPDDDERLLHFLVNNKVSVVHNLTDSNFEHETQAGTGATTGDWLVMFTKSDCLECEMYVPVFETAAVNLKGKKNAAIMKREFSAVTARRFGIKNFPSYVLFRHGKLYRYIAPVVNVAALTTFAEDSFRNSKGELVPQPKSPFDDVTEAAADYIKENTWTVIMSVVGFIAVVWLLLLLNRPPPESWTKKGKKKRH